MAPGWRVRAALAALGVALLAAAAWLLIPRPGPGAPNRPGVRVVVLDASASVARARRGLAGAYLALVQSEARAAEAAGQELAVVRLSPEVRRLVGPCPAASWAEHLSGPWRPLVAQEQDAGTPLDAAVQTAASWLLAGGRAPGELVLCTDGAWTGADPRPRLEALVRAGCRVRRVALPAPNLADGGLVALAGPQFSAAGEPVVLRLDWRGGSDVQHSVEWSLDQWSLGEGSAAEGAKTRRLDLGPGPGSLGVARSRLDLGPLPEGLWRIEVRLVVGAGDRTPENDSLSVVQRVGASPLVGMVARERDHEVFRGPWTRGAPRGLTFDWCRPEDLLTRLPHWDALVTLDLGTNALPGPAVRDFVRSGGGWLAAGGIGLLGGWAKSDLGALLPLEPKDADRDARDVVLLVDGSGSMNESEPGKVSRWDRVRSAVQGLFELVPAQDRVQVWFFTHDLVEPPVFEGSRGQSRGGDLERLMSARAPGGVTNIYDSVHRYAGIREEAWAAGDARQALVLLLSDGYQNSSSSRSPSELRARLDATGVDLRVLSIGVRPRLGVLGSFLRSGEAVVPAGDLGDLERVLVDEVFGDGIRRGAGMALQLVGPEGLDPEGAGAAVLAAMAASSASAMAPLDAYLVAQRSDARPGEARGPSEVLLTAEDGDPLLALRAEGLGHVACLVTLPSAPWCAGLATNPRVLGPLLRLLARPGAGARRNHGARAVLEAGELRISGLDPAAPARLVARVIPAPRSLRDGEILNSAVLPLGPDPRAADPRTARRAAWPWVLPAAGGQVSVSLQTQEREFARLPLAVSLGPEWTVQGDSLPSEWAEPAGKGLTSARREHPLAPWLLGAGLLCMALAAWIRLGAREPAQPRRFGGQGAA